MRRTTLATCIVSLFLVCGAISYVFAADPGPEQITLANEGAKKPKPAIFPHKLHQDAGLSCAECHHGMVDGKQVAYTEEQEIGKCASCHNSEVLAGSLSGKNKLDTMKGAGHGNCLSCHKQVAKDTGNKALKKCSTCHPKKK